MRSPGFSNLLRYFYSTQIKGSFKKAFEKFEQIPKENLQKEIKNKTTFDELLRNSKFMQLGDPCGKIVVGEIFKVCDQDLYIDFGFKFHCVCKCPRRNSKYYIQGTKVKIQINELEMSQRFLGSTIDTTLLEADCTLLGLLNPPATKSEKDVVYKLSQPNQKLEDS